MVGCYVMFDSKKVPNVGTLPSEKHVARISQWHMARIISRIVITRISLKIYMMRFSYPNCLKKVQATFQLLLSGPLQGRANDAYKT